MLGQSAGLQQKKIEDFKECNRVYPVPLYGYQRVDLPGQITGEYSQQMYRFNGLLGAITQGKTFTYQ